jgi:transcriptional regulator with XRE-family HTH domain
MNTIEYLDAVRERLNLGSDYKLAKVLGVHQTTISNYRHGRSALADDVAVRVAELLQLDPARVLADMAAERSSSEAVRAIWSRVAATLSVAAVAVFASVPGDAKAASLKAFQEPGSGSPSTHYPRWLRRLAIELRQVARLCLQPPFLAAA